MSLPSGLTRFGLGIAGCLSTAFAALAALPIHDVVIKATYPHDARAYTQGLFYLDGALFESTGLEGQSNIRRVRLKDGVVLQSAAISPRMFGEGVVNWGDDLISLTWRDQVGFRWDRKTFALKSSFRYAGEGWGLTQDGKAIIMSDGTPVLRFLNPRTLREMRRLRVTAEGRPVANLNELEWVKGEVLANVWQTSLIARINPRTGVVTGWIDLSALPEAQRRRDMDSVPNGIAYDAAQDRLFITGKRWPRLYEISLKPRVKR